MQCVMVDLVGLNTTRSIEKNDEIDKKKKPFDPNYLFNLGLKLNCI